MEECFLSSERKVPGLEASRSTWHCQSAFRLHFVLVVLGIEIICVLGRCSTVPLSYSSSSEVSPLCLFSHLDRSLLQFISVLKPACFNLFGVFSTSLQLGGQVYSLSAEISHLWLLKIPQPPLLAGSQSTILGQGRSSVFGTFLYVLYLVTLSFPCENVNP